MNNEQHRIKQLSENLLATLNAVVPSGTAHYAVEGARRALAELARKADTIQTAAPRTWTFFGHWDCGRIVVEYYYPGDIQDDRVDDGQFDEGLWADSGSGATVEEAEAAARAEYESGDEVYTVIDETLEGDAAILGKFGTEDEAIRFITTLPDYLTGRYGIDGPERPRQEGGDEQARDLEKIRAGNVRLGIEQPVLLAYGDPAEGFYFVGPVIPNDPELDRFVDQELRHGAWWYLPLRSLAQAWQGND